MAKLNNEIIKNTYNKFGLDIIGEYINSEIGVDCIDEQGFKYNYRYCDLKAKQNIYLPTFSSKNKFSYYNKLLWIDKNINNGTELLSNEILSPTKKHIFLCGLCGKQFEKTWNMFLLSKYDCCNECTKKNKKNKENIGYEKVLEMIKEQKYKIIDKNIKHFKYKMKIEVEDENGYKGFTTILRLKNNERFWKFHPNNPFSIDNIKLYLKINKFEAIILSEKYKNGFSNLKFKCECGEIFYCSLDKFKGGKSKCNRCTKSQSKYEIKVENYFRKNNIKYKQQYKFIDCKYLSLLPFDFYIVEKNILIEVDGIGHYKPTRFNGISLELAKEGFEKVLIRDEIKDKYCKDNNIELIRIPYWEIDNKNYINILNDLIR